MNKRQEKGWIINFMCILAILGVFAVSALVLMNVGVHVYKNIAMGNAENFKLRTSLSYIATKVRQTDAKDCIYLTQKDGTMVLTLEEEIDGVPYETLIYYYKGKLYELYQEKSNAYQLSDGMDVMELSDMKFEMASEHLLKATAENGAGDTEELLIDLRTQ